MVASFTVVCLAYGGESRDEGKDQLSHEIATIRDLGELCGWKLEIQN